jgi:hypothetical protein
MTEVEAAIEAPKDDDKEEEEESVYSDPNGKNH